MRDLIQVEQSSLKDYLGKAMISYKGVTFKSKAGVLSSVTANHLIQTEHSMEEIEMMLGECLIKPLPFAINSNEDPRILKLDFSK